MKKSLSTLICFFLIFAFSLSVHANVTTESDSESIQTVSEDVVTKNMLTGEITTQTFTYELQTNTDSEKTKYHDPWFPQDEEYEPLLIVSPYSITDISNQEKINKTKQQPYSAICYLEAEFDDGYKRYGTAWMAYKNIAITAGHCIYSHEHYGYAKKVTVWPAKHGWGVINNPYGTAEATSDASQIHTSTQWSIDGDSIHDWAFLELDKNIGEKSGWLGMSYSTDNLSRGEFTLSGYPIEHQYYQYKSSGYIIGYSAYTLFHNIPYADGQSGAPVFDASYYVYGIQSGEVRDLSTGEHLYNFASLIDDWKFNYFTSFMK